MNCESWYNRCKCPLSNEAALARRRSAPRLDLINPRSFVEKALAFGLNRSMCVDVRAVEVTGGRPFAPTIASIRGSCQ